MNYNFTGRVVLITGASSGIGAALAKGVVKRQGIAVLVARREDAMHALAREIDPANRQTSVHKCDVSDQAAVKRTVAEVYEKWGRIDVAILNAGVGVPTRFSQFESESSVGLFRVNFFSVLYFLEEILPKMRQQRSGIIAGISSIAAHIPSKWITTYAASKAALSHFLLGMHKALKKYNIQVTCVEPGFVRTLMTAHNKKLPFLVDVDDAARRILRGLEKGRTIIRFPLPLAALALLSRLLPARLRFTL